jgi:hypothetical protein
MVKQPPRAIRPSPLPGTPGDYSIRQGDMVDAGMHSELAWQAFFRLCHQAERTARLELLCGNRVIAWLHPKVHNNSHVR